MKTSSSPRIIACSFQLPQVFAERNVGVKQVTERLWLVTFMHCDLGYFDNDRVG
jgi:hypothetical protein